MENFVVSVMNRFGYVGIFLMIMLENLFPPIPSELILSLGGFFTTVTDMTVAGVALASTAGSLCGAVVLYLIGSIWGVHSMSVLSEGRWGIQTGFAADDMDMAQRWFCTKGAGTVFICRFVPILRSLISIPAGMAKMNFVKFLLYTAAGSSLWNTAIINVGTIAGYEREFILQIVDTVSDSVLLVAVFAEVMLSVRLCRRRSKAKNIKTLY
ncbi:MAG: DedA family protein [Oscillospiraceae bacterium]|nr:DedA family protein [Oscillospiraceae bacterium]